MVSDIKLVDSNNGISKYADDITISVPVRKNSDTAFAEVKNFESWAANNRMSLNLSKTWEMLLRSRTTQPAPPPVPGIEISKDFYYFHCHNYLPIVDIVPCSNNDRFLRVNTILLLKQ